MGGTLFYPLIEMTLSFFSSDGEFWLWVLQTRNKGNKEISGVKIFQLSKPGCICQDSQNREQHPPKYIFQVENFEWYWWFIIILIIILMIVMVHYNAKVRRGKGADICNPWTKLDVFLQGAFQPHNDQVNHLWTTQWSGKSSFNHTMIR